MKLYKLLLFIFCFYITQNTYAAERLSSKDYQKLVDLGFNKLDANALSHDVYYKMVDPKADVRKRLLVARLLLIVIGAAAAYIASMRLTSILGAVAWAFDFAMSGLFFPLVLGVWWKRATREGAIAGMLAGLVSGTWYLIYVGPKFMANTPWLGIDHLRFGIIGATVSLVAMVVVSLATKEPDAATQKMVDDIRIPSGKTVISHR